MASLSNDQLFSTEYSSICSKELNSVAVIAKHIAGNLKSRWTDVFSTDGEKEWRERDKEFVDEDWSREQLMAYWEEAWVVLFGLIESLDEFKFDQVIYIRNMGHTLVEAMNRQLAHYSYHIGQIVSISKQIKGESWQSLSIPRGESMIYNKGKFSKPKVKKHFTEDL